MILDLVRVAEVAAHVVVAVQAWRLARPGSASHSPQLKPFAWFLGLTLVSDGVRAAGKFFVLRHAARPFAGAARVVFHVDQAGVLGWSAGLLSLVVLAFTGRERAVAKLMPIWACACGTWLAFASAYPALRGTALGMAYAVVEVITVLACIAFAVHSWLGSRWFDIAPRAATILVAGETATLLGPYLGEPFRHWATANAISVVTYAFMSYELRRSAKVRA